eukprot:gene2046-3032_t
MADQATGPANPPCPTAWPSDIPAAARCLCDHTLPPGPSPAQSPATARTGQPPTPLQLSAASALVHLLKPVGPGVEKAAAPAWVRARVVFAHSATGAADSVESAGIAISGGP